MSRIVIIADDLTGANATGVLLARNGYKTATVLRPDVMTDQFTDYDVICINTDSRGISSKEAYDLVAHTAKVMNTKETALFSKRIDSTLRGNLGAEIDAVLDVIGEDAMAVVVAAFPNSGRITIGGYLMVNSIPLAKTDVAKDPKTPVHLSVVSELINQQSKYEVGHIPLEIVLESPQAISGALLNLKAEGKRLVVLDVTTQNDLDCIAEGVHLSGIKVLAADPGPFTESLAQYFLPPKGKIGKKVLMVVGSVTSLTRQQLKEVQDNFHSFLVYTDALALIDEVTAEKERDRVVTEIINNLEKYQILGLRTVKEQGNVLNLKEVASTINMTEESIAQKISLELAKICREILENSNGSLGALYTSGGDVTAAVCSQLDAIGVEVKDEVLPLAAYGRLIGGVFNSMPIITKGGLVGDPKAIVDCLEYLQTKVSNELYQRT